MLSINGLLNALNALEHSYKCYCEESVDGCLKEYWYSQVTYWRQRIRYWTVQLENSIDYIEKL